MTISGLLAYVDFNGYTPGNLYGQGTSPYEWDVHDRFATASAEFPVVVDSSAWSGSNSGLVVNRQTTINTTPEQTARCVLQSGIPGGYDRYVYEMEVAIPQNNVPTSNQLMLRPSGIPDDFDGWRFVFAERAAPETTDRVYLQRLVGSANGENHIYYVPKSDAVGLLKLRVSVSSNNFQCLVYSAASGKWEQTHDIDSEVYNDHPHSGIFQLENGSASPGSNTSVDNFAVYGVFDSITVSGYVGGYISAEDPATIYADDEEMQGVWRFDESDSVATKSDSSEKGNHLDVIQGTPEHVTGRVNNCIQFKHWGEPYPSVARTSSGVSTGLDPTASNWTFGGWINPSGGAYEMFAQIGGKGGNDGYVIYLDEEMDIWAQVKINGIHYTIHGGRVSGLVQDTWQHLDWVVNRTEGWHGIYRTVDDGIYTPILLARSPIPSGTELQNTTTEPFVFGASPTNREPFDGKLDEWYFRTEALGTDDIRSICNYGIQVKGATDTSGYIGGYIEVPTSPTAVSGYVGGYVEGQATAASGYIGGYLNQDDSETAVSGYIGGYIQVNTGASGYIGGYIQPAAVSSGYIGGYMLATTDTSSKWLSYFDFRTPQNEDFDATTKVGSAESEAFDATCVVQRLISAPTVECALDGANSVSGYAVTFSGVITVADATLPDGRTNRVNSAWIQWGDFSGVQATVDPITGAFEGTHIYTQSGVYTPRINVIDINGAHGSCFKKVDLSVGIDAPIQLNLTATPVTGVKPLAVALTNTYTSQEAGEVESVIDFGDRTMTHHDNPTHVYRWAGNYVPIWIVKDDRGRFWSDSVAVGVNN